MSAADAARTAARGLGQVLITVGLVILLFCVYELKITNVYTARQQDDLGDRLRQAWTAPATAAVPRMSAAQPGTGFAVLRIPRFGRDWRKVVVEGVSTEHLRRGPGHYPGTALPGQVGNTVVSGHRTTYGAPFEHADRLRPRDAIVVEMRDTWFVYRVTETRIVAPTAVDVTYPVPGRPSARPTKRLLTLTTCHPKYSAAQRLIVHAELEAHLPKSAGPPAALREA